VKEGQSDFLDLMEPDEPEVVIPEPAAASSAEAQGDSQGQPRNPDGTFATTKAELDAAAQVQQGVKPEAQPAPGAEPPAADDGSPHVPRAALEAERKKRQALEAQLAKLQPPTGSAPQSQTTAPKGPEFNPPVIDPNDPQTYAQAITSIRMQQSQFFAVQQSSEAEVAEAWTAFDAACEAQPGGPTSLYSQTLVNHPHPMGEILKWHRQQKELAQIQEAGGLEKLREKWLAEHTAQPGATAPAFSASRPPAPVPPPSLAKGGNGAAVEAESFDEKEEVRSFFEEARKPRKR
jgi:hypothetical protein